MSYLYYAAYYVVIMNLNDLNCFAPFNINWNGYHFGIITHSICKYSKHVMIGWKTHLFNLTFYLSLNTHLSHMNDVWCFN